MRNFVYRYKHDIIVSIKASNKSAADHKLVRELNLSPIDSRVVFIGIAKKTVKIKL